MQYINAIANHINVETELSKLRANKYRKEHLRCIAREVRMR